MASLTCLVQKCKFALQIVDLDVMLQYRLRLGVNTAAFVRTRIVNISQLCCLIGSYWWHIDLRQPWGMEMGAVLPFLLGESVATVKEAAQRLIPF